jgi:hypothetical protein
MICRCFLLADAQSSLARFYFLLQARLILLPQLLLLLLLLPCTPKLQPLTRQRQGFS